MALAVPVILPVTADWSVLPSLLVQQSAHLVGTSNRVEMDLGGAIQDLQKQIPGVVEIGGNLLFTSRKSA